jgi:hypothetical protein
VRSHAGMICTGETYKNVVKMTFAKGALLEDPSGLFNSSLEGNTRRAIDFHEGDQIEKALKALLRAAVALNTSSAAQHSDSYSRHYAHRAVRVIADVRRLTMQRAGFFTHRIAQRSELPQIVEI